MILNLPFDSSILASALSLTFPRPVVYAFLTSSSPMMFPPVGKSGALMCFINSSIVIFGLSIDAINASIVSPKLCGAIFVAIPTAIPLDPFTIKLGNLDGSTTGSCSSPS